MTVEQGLALLGQFLSSLAGVAALIYAIIQWRRQKTQAGQDVAEAQKVTSEGVEAITRAASTIVESYRTEVGSMQIKLGALQAQREERDKKVQDLTDALSKLKLDTDKQIDTIKKDSAKEIDTLKQDNATLTAQVNILTDQVLALGGEPLGKKKPGTGSLGRGG